MHQEDESIQLAVKTVIMDVPQFRYGTRLLRAQLFAGPRIIKQLGKPEEVLRSYHEMLGLGRDPTEK
jgi:hypothetical protein